MEKDTTLEHVHSFLEENQDVSLGYLFGSQVDQTTGPTSDIDLAILFEDEADTFENRSRQVLSKYGDYLTMLRSIMQDILGDKGYDRRVQRYRETLRRTERTLSQIRAAHTKHS